MLKQFKDATLDREEELMKEELSLTPTLDFSVKYPENDIQDKVFEAKNHVNTVQSTPIENSQNEKILHSIKATIFETTDYVVRLKIENDTFVNIPRSVFIDKQDILKYGQSVIFSIKKDDYGKRYCDIDLDNKAAKNPYKSKVLKTLEDL